MEEISVAIIGVSGKMRHGKDTVAEHLIDKYKYKRGSYADKVKDICMHYEPIFEWNQHIAGEVLEGAVTYREVGDFMRAIDPQWIKLTHDECYVTKPDPARLKMQAFAQGCREFNPDCWVNYLMKKCIKEGGNWVIPDLRYKNEAFAIEVIPGSQLWRVRRPIPMTTGASHISEVDLDDYPFEVFIDNDGAIKDLHKKVDKIMKAVLRGERPFAKGKEVY